MSSAQPYSNPPFSCCASVLSFHSRSITPRGVLVALCLVFGLLGGCAGTSGSGERDYSHEQTRDMFEVAYGHVQERFIERLPMETIALAGLSGLSVIDGRMQVTPRDGSILLLKEGQEVQRFAWPETNDGESWAAVTADVVDRARQASPVSAAALPEEIYSAVMDAVVGTLDQYSRYEGAVSANNQQQSRNGFGGIGVIIRTENDQTTVVETLPDTPAAAAGLQAGDQITHADGKPLVGLSPQQVAQHLRGKVGTNVVIDVLKAAAGTSARVSIVRAPIVPLTVLGRLEQGVVIIRIRSFNRRTAADLEDEIEQLETLQGGPLPGLVLDLRNNPGGLLDQAVQAADLFLRSGPVITTRGRHPAANSAFAADSYQIAKNVPIVILTNGRSASASEMLAASLQDRGRAVVIGSASHGKGSVQNLQEMPNGGELAITWSRMHSPAGYVLDGLGVLPNICTSKPFKNDAVGMLHYEQDRLARQFQDWRRYDRVDLGLAGTLRRNCPASFETLASDLDLAAKILLAPSIYRLALAPSVKATVAAREKAERRRRS